MYLSLDVQPPLMHLMKFIKDTVLSCSVPERPRHPSHCVLGYPFSRCLPYALALNETKQTREFMIS
jgi:hypothetical protein